jgi:hypothetical protein
VGRKPAWRSRPVAMTVVRAVKLLLSREALAIGIILLGNPFPDLRPCLIFYQGPDNPANIMKDIC